MEVSSEDSGLRQESHTHIFAFHLQILVDALGPTALQIRLVVSQLHCLCKEAAKLGQ